MTDRQHATNQTPLKTRLRTGSLVFAVLILIPAAYGFFYYKSHENYLTNQYFRALSEVEKQINHGLKGADRLLSYAPFSNKKYYGKYKDYLKKYSSSFKNIKFVDAPKECENPSQAVDSSKDTTCFQITHTLGNRKVIVYERKGDVAAKIPLKDFIDPAPALEFFDQLLLLDRSGNLIYRSGHDDLPRTGNVTARDDFARFENLIHYLDTDEVTQLDPATKTLITKKIKSPSSHSTVREATIGNVSYKLFVQPFHAVRHQHIIPASSQEKGKTIPGAAQPPQMTQLAYLVGIIPSDRFFFKVIALPLGSITLLLFAFLVVVLLTPHLKLFFSGPFYMPSRSFCWGLMVTFPMLVLVIMIGVRSAKDYRALRQSFDDTTKSIATQIEKNFKIEYEHIVGANGWLSKPSEKANWLEILRSQNKGMEADECFEENSGCHLLKISDAHYPDFELAFIADGQGKGLCDADTSGLCQQISFRPFPTFSIDVRRRDYFKQPRFFHHTLPLWSGEAKEAVPFFSERIQTYDHGIKLTAFSAPLEDQCTQEHPHCVAVLIKLMHSFFQPVLPAGFGFAVVKDATGNVVHHSNDQRSLLENFYIEIDENSHLIAAVWSRHKQLVDGLYNGTPHRFHITPLPDVPWSLIVFYDLSSMELVNFKISAIAIARAGMFVVLMCVLFVVLYPLLRKPLTVLLPNSALSQRVKARSGFITRHFPFFYVALFEAILLFSCYPLATSVYNYVSERQMEQMAKLNLLHVGKASRDRVVQLNIERGRLGHSSNDFSSTAPSDHGVPKARRYFGHDLFNFGLYADRSSDDRAGVWLVGIYRSENSVRSVEPRRADPSKADYVEHLLPVFNPLDARYRQMDFAQASDLSWTFYEAKSSSQPATNDLILQQQQANGREQFWLHAPKNILASASLFDFFRTDDDSGGPAWRYLVRYLGLALAALLPFYFLYRLMKLTAHRTLGLYFPNRKKWRRLVTGYHKQPLLDLDWHSETGRERLPQRNLTRIIEDPEGRLLDLKSILYNRSQNRIINTDNIEPLMWLIHGGIFKMGKNSGRIDFANPNMMKWIKEQPWKQEIHHYLTTEKSNPWRILAPPFYVALLLLSILLVFSGREVGTMLFTLLSLVMAGGLPFIGHFLDRFMKS